MSTYFPKQKSFLLLLLFSLTFTFCSKKDDPTPTACLLSSYSGTYNGTYTYSNDRLSISNEYGSDATYTYDQKGNIIRVTYNDGSAEDFVYDNNNRKLEITNANQSRLKYIYNSSGQLTVRQLYYFDNSTNTYVLDSYLNFQYTSSSSKNWNQLDKYNATSNLTSTTTFQYDSKSNPWAFVWGTSSVETANNPTQQIYTPTGGPSVTTTIAYTYNSHGFPVSAISTVGSSTTEATYTYMNCP